MPVRIGKIELVGIQDIRTEEVRDLVEQKIPGGSGNIFQNLGGKPVTINMEGIILGEDAYASLEELRQAHVKAKPLPFSADIAVGSDLTDVLIEDFRVKQVAGHKSRYWFTLKVREYIEPPQPADAGNAAVNEGVAADAKTWNKESMANAEAMKNPKKLPGQLNSQPGLLNNMDMSDFGESISRNIDEISGGDFGEILKSISNIDLNTAMELVAAVQEKGGLAKLVGKYVDEGLDLLEDLTGIDLNNISDIVKGFSDITMFLKKLKIVAKSADRLFEDLKEFDLLADFNSLLEGGNFE